MCLVYFKRWRIVHQLFLLVTLSRIIKMENYINVVGKQCKDIVVFTQNVEESAMSQIYDISNHYAYKGKKIRIMPDVHSGKGCVIGFSMPVNFLEDFISPEMVGMDIGCTVSASFYDKPILEDKIAEFEHKIKKEIPFGRDINEHSKVDWKTIATRFNEHIDRLCSFYPIFKNYTNHFKSEKDLETLCNRIGMDYGYFLKSLGTVGSGNHYVEYDTNEELNKYCISVHCGSRNFGLKVFNYWYSIATKPKLSKEDKKTIVNNVKAKNTDKRKLKEELKEALDKATNEFLRTNGYLSGDNLFGYLADVLLAQTYAEINHMLIHKQISDIYSKMSNGGKQVDYIETKHNYIDYDFKALSGTPNMILRKGAVRAYKDERIIIPFNMRDGISICVGKSNEEWNFTAPHGCGRLMSRSKAKETLSLDDFKKTMSGIYTTTADINTLDEAPSAYKPYEEIIDLIKPTVDIMFLMKPKMNIKGVG